ncbi:MAG TPA: branched-chain amino acid ABC transporter substrate-binding protein [Actinophytocola sp.]|uniref:branched-chain amino acid ABC transporter substrate-binding protein n=1 Tax=Actinophytocola sp. TaxID=1872138 RepID=UPI002DBE4CC6|nr:branched-chain amino acid ABC transporter substrate-binding protein [Actinophytocola sp.]HEU5475293.1 branched-chain amino acid ABC transporter substrate-binding protein [Actinophytocola sp.]
MRNQTAKAAVLVAAGALVLAACGTNKEESGGGGGQAACDTSKGTLIVGVIAPQSGSLSALGLGIKNSADLAVKQANEACKVKGYKLALQTEDDQATAQVGAQAATKLSSNPNVVGVIGTLNSSVAQSVQPVLAQKKIAQISPANTNPSLTQGTDYATSKKRPFETYFRVCTTDALQGPFGATYMVSKAGKKKIATISDGKTYGVGLVQEFTKQATKLGAAVVANETVGEKDTDFGGVIAKIRGAAPDAVYYGGEYPIAGPLSKQMKDAGLNVPLMGGDGIFDPKFIELGGADGDLATSVGAPTESLSSAKAFVDAYAAANYPEAFSAYGAFSYDSANALIGALATTMGDSGTWGEDKRADLLKNIGSYKATGATGEVAFDEYGDSTNKLLTVYQVSGKEWKPVETGKFEG